MDTKPPPLPPFTFDTVTQKVRMDDDASNRRDPQRVVLVYARNTIWRNRVPAP